MRHAIGIDLGGTNIKAVALSETGELLGRATRETKDDASGESAERTRGLISEIEKCHGIHGALVGLAAPGMASRDARAIVSVHGKLQDIIGLDWTNFLNVSHSVPVLNDAQAALLGEAWIGAAAGRSNVVLLTLGTGVGGAIVAEGRLIRGHNGKAGHLGYICLDVDGETTTLGLPGTLEYAIGNSTVRERTNNRFQSTRELVEAHLSGDTLATAPWLRSVYCLACAIASIINALDPEMIIVGGGIARAGRALFDPLDRYLDGLEWRPNGERIPVVTAQLGEYAGAVGAAFSAIQANNGNRR
jgi:glucokinase